MAFPMFRVEGDCRRRFSQKNSTEYAANPAQRSIRTFSTPSATAVLVDQQAIYRRTSETVRRMQLYSVSLADKPKTHGYGPVQPRSHRADRASRKNGAAKRRWLRCSQRDPMGELTGTREECRPARLIVCLPYFRGSDGKQLVVSGMIPKDEGPKENRRDPISAIVSRLPCGRRRQAASAGSVADCTENR